jgi:nitronate monooxygenase
MVERFDELLEAERAGVACLSVMSREEPPGDLKDLLAAFLRDEGRYCAGLVRIIKARGAVPTERTGPFAEKVLALPPGVERIALLVRGQAWVARKIADLPQGDLSPEEAEFFAEMRERHLVNVEKCRARIAGGG